MEKENKKAFKASRKKWYNANSYKWIEYARKKRKEDIYFRLVSNLKGRIWHALKGKTKKDRTLALLGCSPNELKIFLQKKFQSGMTWENYGEWHVDHKRPCASFDLTKESEQRKCFNYKNLQPLWALENREKSDKQ